MAVTITLFDHTAQRFANGANAVGDTYKVNLYSAFTLDTTATTKAAAESGNTQLSTANGYTQNDKTLGSVTVTKTGNDAAFDAADVSWTASSGSIEAVGALIYNDTDADDPPLAYIDFDGTQSAGDGTDFKILWDAAGIVTFTVA